MTNPDSILSDYRQTWASAPVSVDSAAIWNSISVGISQEPAPAKVHVLFPSWMRYAAAAVVFIGGMLLMARYLSLPQNLDISTGHQQIAYTLQDGSVVTLRQHSSLRQLPTAEGVERYELTGEAWFEVVPAQRTFEVVTIDGLIRVLGTKFNVRTWDEGTTVYLESGSVGFSNDIGDIRLEPGFEASATTSASPIRVVPAEPARAIAWTRNELILDETPLSEVVRELEHHYQIRLDLPDELAVQSVSGRLLLLERDRTLDQLRMITGHAFPIQSP
jgi:transmembrane sensor